MPNVRSGIKFSLHRSTRVDLLILLINLRVAEIGLEATSQVIRRRLDFSPVLSYSDRGSGPPNPAGASYLQPVNAAIWRVLRDLD